MPQFIRKARDLFLQHKAIVVGILLVLILVILDGGIFVANFTRKAVDEVVKQEEQKKQEVQQQQQTEQQQQQNTNTGGTGTAKPQCNQTQANTYTAQYNAAVAAENARHDARIVQINNSPEIFPGYKQITIAQENAQHQANLNNLNAQYQANLRSVNC